ncbi:THAP domain-containing protein 9, partial [Cyphomyrmex costatus]
FASTVSFMSPKACKYIRNVFPVLPHLSTLRKWHAEIDVKPGICQAALEILTEKHVQANKTGKKLLCSMMVDDIAIRKHVRWNGKQYTGFVTYNKSNIKNVKMLIDKNLSCQQYQYGLHAGTKIRKRRINFQTEKMRVRLATQLLSCSVSNALYFLRTTVKLPEFVDFFGTEKFCIMLNNIFDLLNSRQKNVKNPSKSPINRSNITEIRSKVMEYENYITSLQCNRKSILTTKRKLGFFGLIISMRSCIAIFDNYASTDESPLQYILTYKL